MSARRRRRTRQAAQESIVAQIESLSHDGRGICRIDGKAVFVTGALPGEQVELVYQKQHNQYADAIATTILTPAAERQTPACEFFSRCGGCSLQHLSSQQQIAIKQQALIEQFKHFGDSTLDQLAAPITGPTLKYRTKARLGVKYVEKKQTVLVGFREINGRYITDMNRCEILAEPLPDLIQPLRELLGQLSIKQAIPQIEVAISAGDTLLILRHLQQFSATDLSLLSAFARERQLILYLQPQGPNSIHPLYPPDHDGNLHYSLSEFDLNFSFSANDFTQVNQPINRQMVAQAVRWLALKPTDQVLDLFCGLGNFSLAIARHAGQVIGIEADAALIQRAQHNASANGISNADFYSADLYQALPATGWTQAHYDKVLLDPPRSGALDCVHWISQQQIARVVYVSCNPATLARDAQVFKHAGYSIEEAGIMDMFPHTKHTESMVCFQLPA